MSPQASLPKFDRETSSSPHLIHTASSYISYHSFTSPSFDLEPQASSLNSHRRTTPHTPPLPLPLRSLQRIPISLSANMPTLHTSPRQNNDILSKSPRQRLLSRNLLTPHKRIHSNSNSAINVLTTAVIRQSHLAKRLGNAHDGFEMSNLSTLAYHSMCEDKQLNGRTYRNRVSTRRQTLPPHITKKPSHFVLIDLV